MHRLLYIGLAIIGLATAVCAADWPQFLGPTRNGFSPDKIINTDWTQQPPKMLWKTPLTDRGYAGPSVAQSKVFIIDHAGDKDIVRALSLTTGEEVWRYAYPDTAQHNYGFARSTPTYANGRLYTLSRLGILLCLDAEQGTLIWSRNLAVEFQGRRGGWDYASSPLVDGNLVILNPGGPQASLIALEAKTGATVWQSGSDVASYATPVVATMNGTKSYLAFGVTQLIGYDAATGRQLWSFPWRTGCDVNAATPVVHENLVFITSGYGKGCAAVDVTPQGATQRWVSKTMQAHFSSPILYQGAIYGDSDPGDLVCLNPATGEAYWRKSGFEKGGVVATNDGLLVAMEGRSGTAVLVRMSTAGYQELGRFTPLGGQSWTAPVIANGKLIIRNTQAIACFDLQ